MLNFTMTEEYITYKQALALKECGFDWECNRYYSKEDAADGTVWEYPNPTYENFNDGSFGSRSVSAPTQALAQKWLRDVKEVDIIVTLFRNIDARVEPNIITRLYAVEVCMGQEGECSSEFFPTYEAALSAGIDAVLESIKAK